MKNKTETWEEELAGIIKEIWNDGFMNHSESLPIHHTRITNILEREIKKVMDKQVKADMGWDR